jgi:parallel beta-helix repeat protein
MMVSGCSPSLVRLLILAALAIPLIACGGDPGPEPTVRPSLSLQSTPPARVPEATGNPTEEPTATPEPQETPKPDSTAEPGSDPAGGQTQSPATTPAATGEISGEIVVSPGSSISQAVAGAAAGATVLVRGGTYFEEIAFGKAVTVQAFGDGEVVIDGQCSRQHGFLIWGNGATIRGLTVRNTISASVLLEAAGGQPLPSNVTIDGNKLIDFDCQEISDDQYRAGVAVWFSGPGIRITNNQISRRSAGEQRGWANGIWFKSSDAMPSGGGHYIAGNTIVGGWDGIGSEVEYEARGGFDRDTIIEGNTIRDCWDDGLQIEGGTQNVIVRNNDISGCGTGIAFAAPVTGPLYVENNYIHDLRRGRHDNLFCFKVGNPGAGVTYLTENRCIVDSPAERGSGGANGIAHTDNGLAPIVARNNIFRVSRYVFEMREGTSFTGTSFDGDCLWSSNPESFIEWAGRHYGSLADFISGTGMEANGRQSANC